MSWARELLQAFEQLQAGNLAEVVFACKPALEEELGREWNSFAERIVQLRGKKLTREQRHDLWNQLAGILAAVHVLSGPATFAEADRSAVRQILAEAKKLEARFQSSQETKEEL